MKYISVFCGSSSGNDDIFTEQAQALGEALAGRGYGIIYGGARVGLMGVIADSVLDAGGKVIGVIPHFLKRKEIQHNCLTETHVVETMHERKELMSKLCDAVIALPGGYGTLEELFEMLTWGQLNLHKKPVAMLNIGDYYNPIINMRDTMIEKGFLKKEYHNLLIIDDNIDSLIHKIETYIPSDNEKWDIVK